MTAPTILNTEIRNRLDKELRNRKFTRADFHDIADRIGKPQKNISSCLHMLHKRGLLEIVKTTKRKNGGGAENTYRVVKGASFEIRHSGTIKKESCEKAIKHENENALACRRLERVVTGWAGA